VIAVPAATFTVGKTKPTISTVNVTCKVEGIYPLPQLELIQEDGPHGSRYGRLRVLVFLSNRDVFGANMHRNK
jgi:hypothetical protein